MEKTIIKTSLKRLVKVKITDGPHVSPDLVEEGIPFVSVESVVDGKIDFNKKRGNINKEVHNIFCLKAKPQFGDIFIVKSGSTTGKIAIVDTYDEFSIWSPLALIRSNDLICNKLLYYILQSSLFQLQIQQYWSFGTQPNIGMNKIEQLQVEFPKSKYVQSKIVEYLDTQSEKINHFIQKKQRFIELLKEQRQSIINYAVTKGEDKWISKRLKFIADLKFSNVDKNTKEDEISVRLCNYVDVYKNDYISNNIDFMNATATESEIEKFKVLKGDVIITKDSEEASDIAVPAFVKEDLENVVCGYHLALIRADETQVLSEYLFRVFQSRKVNSHFEVEATGVTRVGLSLDDISTVRIAFPKSIKEQQEIITYIKTETQTIDTAITKAEKEIELIKEYKEAMIAEAVMGKVNLIAKL